MKKEAVDNTASFLFVCLFATNYSATVLYNVSGVVDVVVYADVLLVVNLFVNFNNFNVWICFRCCCKGTY